MQALFKYRETGGKKWLDNLKLGYGGTKTEMERLLEDAEKLSGVEYDIDNLSDVYEAIHVIQEDLGITGTTAEEAATTFSGSMASMKAAASNLLGDMALGEDITQDLQNLVSTASTFLFDNAIPMVVNIITSIGNAILTADWAGMASQVLARIKTGLSEGTQMLEAGLSIIQNLIASITENLPSLMEEGSEIIVSFSNGILENIPELLTTAGEILTNFVTYIGENLPVVLNAGSELLSNLTQGIMDNLPEIAQSAMNVIDQLVGSISENLPAVLEAGVNMLLNIVNGIVNNLPTVVSTAAQVVAHLIAEIAAHLPEILQQGITLLGKLAEGIIAAIPKLVASIPQVISSIVNVFSEYDWGQIGSNIISGIWDGLQAGWSWLIDSVSNLASSLLGAAKDTLGIASPSKAFRDEIGQWIPAGIAEGITDNSGSITGALESAMDSAMDGVQSDITFGVNQSQSSLGQSAAAGYGALSGYSQNITINSPTALTPSEVARQTRNATRNMVLAMRGV